MWWNEGGCFFVILRGNTQIRDWCMRRQWVYSSKGLGPSHPVPGCLSGHSLWGILMYLGEMLITEQCQCSIGNGPGWGEGALTRFTSIAGCNVTHKRNNN